MAGKLKRGKRCSASCPTQDHRTFGECLRAKNLNLSPAVNDGYATKQKSWDRELDSYESAVRQGLSPRATRQWAVDEALKGAENG